MIQEKKALHSLHGGTLLCLPEQGPLPLAPDLEAPCLHMNRPSHLPSYISYWSLTWPEASELRLEHNL